MDQVLKLRSIAFGAVLVLVAGCTALPPAAAPGATPGIRPVPANTAPLPVDATGTAAPSPALSNPASSSPASSSPASSSPASSSPATPGSPSAAATPTAAPSAAATSTADATPPKDTRSGRQLDQPYVVNGIVVVSKKHPISKRYQRKHPGKYGLEKEVAAALAELTAAAKQDGVKVLVRSGYRSYAEQDKILKRKIVEYGSEKMARRYNAEPGKSEHQTGLAVDLWDGVTWGLGVRNTKVGKWLWKHAREYGFILRYPPGKEKITGYAYEPWHFRYIGVEDSLTFKPNSKLTLEEYLGID
ncbi:MAG: M15 family metallopeptidase [Propionicimonas sp.]|nr:M15 family metallopeptidase [Propionicimonas sp.]